MVKRVKTVQESDLRMLGSLARNIQRVLPVTQADIDAAAALGKGWVVWKVFEVSDPLDNLRGGTQLIIRQNSIQPGQNVRRVIFVAGPGGQTVVIRGTDYIVLPDAIADSLSYVKAFGGTEQRNIPQPYTQVNYVTNTAQTAVDTGIMIDFAKNYEFEIECRAVGGSWYILQSRENAGSYITGISGSTSGNTITLIVGGTNICQSATTRTVGNKLYVKATLNAGVATLYVKDETANTEDTQTGIYGTTQPNPTAAVYLLGNAGGQHVDVNSDIYMARIKENDTVVMDYVPARQAATAGFYDKASGTFKTALTPANLSADGNTVPTPDTPMDIVSNNGVLKARHQSGLPLGYTLLEYIESTGSQCIGTGVGDNTGSVSAKAVAQQTEYTGTSQLLFGVNEQGAAGTYFGVGGAAVNWGFGTTPAAGMSTIPASTKATIKLTFDSNGGTATINGETVSRSKSSSIVRESLAIFAASSNGMYYGRYKLWSCEVYRNNVLVRNFVPCKNASNVVGLYDKVNGVFYTDTGFVAGNPVNDIEIYTDGTVETINVHTKNLLNPDTNTNGYRLTDTGTVTSDSNAFYTAHIPVVAGSTYTYNQNTGSGIILRICEYDSTNALVKLNKYSSGGQQTVTITMSANTSYIIISADKRFVSNPPQLERGSTATEYQPYFDGGTATAEMLLKVGDYQDVQSILDGVVTRKVGVAVLDGTETITKTSSVSAPLGYYFSVTSSRWAPHVQASSDIRQIIYCSHLKGVTAGVSNLADATTQMRAAAQYLNTFNIATSLYTTEAGLSQWLAGQYAAGTPVIVVYPLATPTTESVAGQTLQVTDGDNVLEITQASLNGLELEAEYRAAVSLTIQEVQDANLDPNVQVTIS